MTLSRGDQQDSTTHTLSLSSYTARDHAGGGGRLGSADGGAEAQAAAAAQTAAATPTQTP